MSEIGKNAEQVISEHNVYKTYSYKKDDLSLDFTIRTDATSIKSYRAILAAALAQLDKDLEAAQK